MGNIKLSKTQLHKIVQSGRLLERLLGPLLKSGLSLIGNVVKQSTNKRLNTITINDDSISDGRSYLDLVSQH